MKALLNKDAASKDKASTQNDNAEVKPSDEQNESAEDKKSDELTADMKSDKAASDIVNMNFLHESETLKKSKTWSIGQRYYEYLQFMSSFPKLIASDRVKLKGKLEEILGYHDFKNLTIKDLNFSKSSGFPIIEKYAIEHGMSLK